MIIKSIALMTLISMITSCSERKPDQPATGNTRPPDSAVKIEKALLVSDYITLSGQHLNLIQNLKGQNETTSVDFSILSKQDNQLVARILTGFKFSFLGANSLLFSETANAQEVKVPLVIEIPAGSISPASIESSNAKAGMILVFDGKIWKAQVPEKTVVLPTSGPVFVGSTDPVEALNTIPSTKAKAACETKYPSSMQCTLNDIHIISQNGDGPKKNGSYLIAGPSLVSKSSRLGSGTILVVNGDDRYLDNARRRVAYPIACCSLNNR